MDEIVVWDFQSETREHLTSFPIGHFPIVPWIIILILFMFLNERFKCISCLFLVFDFFKTNSQSLSLSLSLSLCINND